MINLSYPRKDTLTARCLARLLLGETLKHRDADSMTGSYRLSGYIHYLKEQHGWPTDRNEIVEDTLDPVGRKASYTEYWLDKKIIKLAGRDGKNYAREVLGIEATRIEQRLEKQEVKDEQSK